MERATQQTKETLASTAYDRLRGDILRGNLKPGLKLRVEYVSERYDAGTSPVREALNRLSAEGLVDRRDQRGFYVRQVSKAELLDLTRTRCRLEEMALRDSVAARSAEWEERLVLSFHRLSRVPRSVESGAYRENPEWERLHREFHRSLISACGSKWLMDFCEQLADQAYRYRQLAVQAAFPKRDEREEHRRIMQAAIDGDADSAVGLLLRHYRHTADIILNDASATIPEGPA
jgi:DNA-binding GntR family transcriptional regulator